MAKEPKNNLPGDQGLLGSFLKTNKEDHYNFEESIDYRVSSGSLLFDYITGGLNPGAHRFIGSREAGKTSSVLTFMYNFLNTKVEGFQRKGVYIKAEGRLSKEMMDRTGLKFVFNANDWVDGTCFVFESNVYEAVLDLMRSLVFHGHQKKDDDDDDNEANSKDKLKTQYFFVIDSADSLCRRDDIKKDFTDADKVAGGALLTSVFFKKCGLAMTKRGHIAVFLGQDRDTIKLDPRQKIGQKQGNASGGNSIQHQANWVLKFDKPWKEDGIYADKEEKDKVGHYARLTIEKSSNETTGKVIRYPVRYGQKQCNSIWKEYEVFDCLLAFQLVKKGGKWFEFTPDALNILKDKGLVFESLKLDGEANMIKFLTSNPQAVSILHGYFKSLMSVH